MTKRNFFLLLAAACCGLSASAQDALPGATPEPDWVTAVPPGEWCGTNQRYMAELVGRGMHFPEAVCPPKGPCDDPGLRDAFIPMPSTPVLTVRLSIHVFCRSNGSDCAATQADVDTAVAWLNADFAPYGLQFTYEAEFIRDNKYRFLDVNNETGAMKSKYADSPETKLNIYVVDTGTGLSFGTFPWSVFALTFRGGVVIDDNWFGVNSPLPTILTHEVGHCLGLWHTFHGVDEVELCGDCYEAAGRSPAEGDITGDLCADTNPTPTNANNCFDPAELDPCTGNPWTLTPYFNFMGYSHTCSIEFTDQQAGRMHCWTNDVLSGWLEQPPPPPTPGITVAPTSGLETTEAGGTDAFTVVLDTPPTALVSVDVSTSDVTEGLVSSGAQGPATLITLYFDDTDWSQPQTVTVTGQDDPDLDGDITYSLDTAPASSADLDYDGLDANDVAATNLDDESPPGISVDSILPATMDAGTTISVTITGAGFQANAAISFENGNGPAPSPSNVSVVNSTTITANLSVSGGGPKGTRVWDVRITNPDTSTGVLPGGFTVVK